MWQIGIDSITSRNRSLDYNFLLIVDAIQNFAFWQEDIIHSNNFTELLEFPGFLLIVLKIALILFSCCRSHSIEIQKIIVRTQIKVNISHHIWSEFDNSCKVWCRSAEEMKFNRSIHPTGFTERESTKKLAQGVSCQTLSDCSKVRNCLKKVFSISDEVFLLELESRIFESLFQRRMLKAP